MAKFSISRFDAVVVVLFGVVVGSELWLEVDSRVSDPSFVSLGESSRSSSILGGDDVGKKRSETSLLPFLSDISSSSEFALLSSWMAGRYVDALFVERKLR